MKTVFDEKMKFNNLPEVKHNLTFDTSRFSLNLMVYLLERGSATICVNGQEVELSDGEMCVVDSYEVYQNKSVSSDAKLKVLVVPFRLLNCFNAKRKNMSIKNRLIKNPQLCKQILYLIENYLEEESSLLVKNSATELILSLIFENLSFGDNKYGEESSLIRKILIYIHANFKGGASLKEVSLALGYTEAHVSRVFHKYLNTNVTSYINTLRYQEVKDALQSGANKKMIDLIYEAGFKSQQTYYRFKREFESR